MDVYEDEAVICLELELAGVNPKDVVVRVNRGLISIEGVKKEPPVHGKSAAFHCAERTYGSFKRMFAIHGTIDEGKIEAEYRNGVLTLRLPKVQERRKGSHTIRVRIND